MGLINRATAAVWHAGHAVARAFRPRAEGTSTITTSVELEKALRQTGWIGGGESSAGVYVSPAKAMQCAAVYSCVRVLAESVAHLPLVLYRLEDGGPGGRAKRLPAKDLPLYRILYARPNEWQTSFEIRELWMRDLCLRGNAYGLKVRGARNRIIEIIRIHPDRVTVKQDPTTLVVTYEILRPNGQRITVPRADMLHIRGLGDDGLAGLNPIQYHRNSIGLALATEEHGSRLFRNAARPSGILVLPPGSNMGQEARQDLREDFESMYQGVENAHKTAILPGGIDFKPLTMTSEDAQFLETRKYQRSEIASIFRVPPHKIGDLERSTNNNIEHQALEFVTDTLTPWLVRFEQAIARDLLDNDPALFVKFNVDALLRGDFKSRQEGLQIQRRNGIINANDWRELDDRNPREDEGGEQYIVEANMVSQSAPAPEPQQSAPGVTASVPAGVVPFSRR